VVTTKPLPDPPELALLGSFAAIVVVFGALHFQGADSTVILPVIAVLGVGQCLVYERTGSLFAVIAIHPRLAGRWPIPVPA
jgi:membrane protease YdiL (CAAX protease family)